MRKIRVLIVDDSTVIRMMLTNALSVDPDIEVAGVAANGKIALAKIPQLNPDIVTLDIEMPEMDGVTTLCEIRKLYPQLPVIMFSTLTQRGAESTLEALSKGANDYVTKPSNVGSVNAALQTVRNDLLPKLKCNCVWYRRNQLTKPLQPAAAIKAAIPRVGARPNRIDLLAIGSSTGGPNALANVIGRLPAEFPVPIAVVQHMPPIFTRHLAERLNHQSKLTVKEAEQGDVLQPGTVLLAPGDFHMSFERKGTQVQVALGKGAPENSCRPAVDAMYRSAVDIVGGNLLAVVLTGMGQDGLRGCEVIRRAGGTVFVQDESSSVVWGMPGAVAQAGLADQVIPLEKMAEGIVRECGVSRVTKSLQKIGI